MDQDPVTPLPQDDNQTADPSPPPATEPSEPTAAPEPTAAAPERITGPDPVAAAPYEIPSIDPSPTSAPKASGARKGIVAGAAALGVLLGVLAVKVIIGLVVGGVAASAFGAAFGGPWDRLPSETKDQLNQRAEAALGAAGNGLSDTEKGAKLIELGRHGLSRLDDQTLIHRVELYKAALDALDETTCAAVMRSSMAGAVSDEDAKELVGSLTTEQFGEWVDIWVRALEAEAKGDPPARTVSDSDSSAMYEAVFAGVSDDELATIQSLSVGTTVTDAEACQANRALYAAGLGLDDANLGAFALTDVSQ